MKTTGVAIVGGGIAGLNALRLAEQSDLDAQLFEANHTPGGRMASERLPNGDVINLGGEFINGREEHPTMHGLADKFGIELTDVYDTPGQEGHTIRYNYGGRVYNEAEIFEGLQPLFRKMQIDAGLMNSDPGFARELDRTPILRYLGDLGLSRDHLAIISDFMVAMWGAEAGELPASSLFAMGFTDLSSDGWRSLLGKGHGRYLIQGGSQALTDAMASAFDSRIAVNCPLDSITMLADGRYELALEGGSRILRADEVILAVPLPALRRVGLEASGLDGDVLDAIQRVHYGTNGKIIPYFERRPPGARLDVTHFLSEELGGAQVWENARGSNRGLAVTIFSGGSEGAGLNDGSFDDRKRAALQREYPGLAGIRPDFVRVKNWADDPLAGGSYASPTFGQGKLLAQFTRAHDGLHFAGEHAERGGNTGYMESAALSAEQAVAEIRNDLRPD